MKLALAVAAVLSGGHPATAQTSADAAYAATLRYADCLIRENRNVSEYFVAVYPTDAEAERRLRASSCSADGVTAGRETLRGAIAERIYLTTVVTPPKYAMAIPPVSIGPTLGPNIEAASCIAGTSPRYADGLVRAQVGSAAERRAIKQLTPILKPCLAHYGVKVFDRIPMRGMIAAQLLVSHRATEAAE